jgi:hypothetical protein
MDKTQILQFAKSDPRFAQALQQMKQQIGGNEIPPEQLAELIKMLEFALNQPEAYPQILQAAIKDGYIDAGDLPEQFDPVALISVLVLLYGMEEQLSAPAQEPMMLARGGLAQAAQQLQRAGRGGDTMLAHINPEEAAMLRRAGGSGSINPHTGLPEFWSVKSLIKSVLPIALTFLAPGIGTAIGSALGASAAWAPVLGSALMGGASSALTGGNVLQGAMLGGLTGGLGGMAGSAANNAMGLGLGASGQAALGSGLLGGALSAARGQNVMQGATQGALGGMLGNAIGGMGGAATQAGGAQFGNMISAGYDPKQAATAGALTGLATGMMKPSAQVVKSYETPGGTSAETGIGNPGESAAATPKDFNFGSAMKLLPLASMMGGAPQAAQQAISTMSPAQQEYFNRPSIKWDWGRMQQDAASSGQDLSQYMAQNWNKISSGVYNQAEPQVAMARGGALSQIASFAQGAGSGRADTIDAKLSDGEYVMDAETVAMLGDGSNKAGAAQLDRMREMLRAHKGKTLARGKISPDAKSPLEYLKGAR